MPTTKKNNLLEYKGHPLMRKENIIYYGSPCWTHPMFISTAFTAR